MAVLEQFRLNGKTAVITGGSRGLGLEIAKALGEAGADLVISARDAAQLDSAAEELRQSKIGNVTTLPADLSDAAGADAFCDELLSKVAQVDVLVNNVGGRRINLPIEEITNEQWQMVQDLNLNQAFVCTRRIGTTMLARNAGRIINIASISGLIAFRPMKSRSYEAAKSALLGFTRSVAADWASRGVTVNAIAPGAFLTDANQAWFDENPELKRSFEDQIPMGRLGHPPEIGPLAVYLASDASAFMTGATLVIDGGQTLW